MLVWKEAFFGILNVWLFFFKESSLLNQKKTSRQKRDQKIASVLVLIVIAFGICNIVRWFFHVHNDDDDHVNDNDDEDCDDDDVVIKRFHWFS